MFTASGLLVRFLKVFEKSNYQSVKWVRYLSRANGTYQIRVRFTPLSHVFRPFFLPWIDRSVFTQRKIVCSFDRPSCEKKKRPFLCAAEPSPIF
jgi:hypothetical protein